MIDCDIVIISTLITKGDTMKIHLSKKINFDRENKIKINNIFNKALRNENIFDIYNIDKHMRYPIIYLHCMLVESPEDEPIGDDIDNLIINQQLHDEYKINEFDTSHTHRISMDVLNKLYKRSKK